MDNVINLQERIHQAEKPDNDHVYVDERGITWYEWAYEYQHNGKPYGYTIWATSQEEASEMLKSMGRGEIKGQIYSSGDLSPT